MEFFDAITGLFLQFIDLVLHLDKHLAVLVQQYGPWIYAILFFIVFAETGFVVVPFLPGDSLLFVAGALAAIGDMALLPLMLSLSLAAVLGNSLNYVIGRWFGHRILAWNSRLLNRAALEKTHAFFEVHGGKTLVISRFLPLLRTFAPFVAGMGEMGYGRFTFFNVVGGVSWVVSLSLAGYWFGNLPLIKNNLSLVIVLIIAVSLLPAVIGYCKARKASTG
ncbi:MULTISPECIES: DedA family protein [Azospira]|uniref:DedA family protein n=1 Tax=Azospira TaxID=146937 RepID=UPI0012119434|nr:MULTISPECIES: DedA family protein [Azospira]MDK9690644.1 DedA family protein [Azospira sp.]TLS18266.1 MAG: DedA family protein [Betaproteobacteria bacterium]